MSARATMLADDVAQPWLRPGWREDVEVWIAASLASAGLTMSGPPLEIHRRTWSLVLKIPVGTGIAYFKAPAHLLRHEGRQLAILAGILPTMTPELIAVEPDRGWMLTLDAGVPLGDPSLFDTALATWEAFAPQYARFQRLSMEWSSRLLACGTFDRRVAQLPGQLARLLEEVAEFRFAESLTPGELSQLERWGDQLRRIAPELSRASIPPAIQCDDLHGWNVYAGPGGIRVIDWGDACITHPFGSLLVLEKRLAEHLSLPPGDAALRRVRSAYLGEFSDMASPAQLARQLDLSLWTAPLVRALTWHETLCAGGEAAYLGRGDSVPTWLRLWLSTPCPDA